MEDRGLRGLNKFTGTDFPVWKAQTEAYFTAKGSEFLNVLTSSRPRRVIKGTTEEVDQREDEILTFEEHDRLVRSQLLLALDNKHARLVLNCKTSRDIWERLSSIHEQSSEANKIVLQKEFFELQMTKEEKVEEFITRAEYLWMRLQDANIKTVDEATLVNRIVTGLPKRFMGFMSSWASVGDTMQTLKILIPRLMAEEQLIGKFYRNTPESSALVSELQKGDGLKGPNNQRGKLKGRINNQTQGKPDQDAQGEKKAFKGRCHKCGKVGHMRRDCRLKQAARTDSTPEVKKEAAIIESESIIVEEANACGTSEDEWIIDSGATEHMSFEKGDFINYTPLQAHRNVKFANRQIASIVGVGDVVLDSEIDGTTRKITLKNVLHIPELRRKLISISAATERGMVGYAEGDTFTIKSTEGSAKIVADRKGRLYVARVGQSSKALSVAFEDKIALWHDRFGHANYKTLMKMSNAKSVWGMPVLDEAQVKKTVEERIKCTSCLIGKQAKKPFRLSEQERASKPGEVLHSDICGPVGVSTMSGANYFMLVKDEHSSYRLIYFMKSRIEAYECLKKALAQVAAETGTATRYLVSDCGSEYTSGKTQELLLSKNIVHRTSAPFCPQQNGLIERDNRTVMEGTRSMMARARAPSQLWGEAANAFIYLVNRTINVNTAECTPFQLYHGRPPRVEHLRVFGCLAMVKTQTKKRSGYQKKTEARSTMGAMVGYDRDFTYRIFVPETSKVIISRDVEFDESKLVFDKDESLDLFRENLLEEEAPDEVDSEEEVHMVDAPQNFGEALRSQQSDLWLEAAREEYGSLLENQTWSLVELPPGRKAISCKWVFAIKNDGRFKARLVARGFTQKPGVDYQETFSPTVRADSIRILLNLANELQLETMQLDIKTAFLHGQLQEEIYMAQPEGFEEKKTQDLVCKLHKSIYGLKQASRNWNDCFSKFLIQFDLKPLKSDGCVFINREIEHGSNEDAPLLIIAIYVDDGLVLSNKRTLMDAVINHLATQFEVKSCKLGTFVGFQVERHGEAMLVHQSDYISKIIARFDLNQARGASVPLDYNQTLGIGGTLDGISNKPTVDVPYQQAIGSLLYAAMGTRPDIACAVNCLARFSQAPKLEHWTAVKRVFRYLIAYPRLGLKFERKGTFELTAYSDASHGGCPDTRRSRSGSVIMLNHAPIAWKSCRQGTVTTSTCESEFVAATLAAKEVLWVRHFLKEIGIDLSLTPLFIDNQGTVKLIRNNQVHVKTKHLDISLFYIREINEKHIKVEEIAGIDQIADILTKALEPKRHHLLADHLVKAIPK